MADINQSPISQTSVNLSGLQLSLVQSGVPIWQQADPQRLTVQGSSVQISLASLNLSLSATPLWQQASAQRFSVLGSSVAYSVVLATPLLPTTGQIWPSAIVYSTSGGGSSSVTAPTLTITTPISGDGNVSNGEDESPLTISGTSSGADGRTVTVNVGGTNYTATIASGGAWSVTLTSTQIKALTEGTVNVTADVTDVAGNPATQATASFVYTKTVVATDPNFANVSLLLHMDGSNGSTTFIDSSSSGLTISRNGNAVIGTAQSKFGGASGAFDGNGDWLYAPAGAGNFAANNFTIEGWFRFNTTSHNGGLFHVFAGTPNSTIVGLALGHNGSEFQVYAGGSYVGRTYAVSANTWYHIALVRSSSSLTLYVNGIAQGAGISDSTNYGGTNGVNIGIYYSSSFTFNGFIDDFRITKDIARYTANFTPPTAAFPDS